jgi:predicted esterase
MDDATNDGPLEHHLEVPRTARYSTLGDGSQASEVWFVLHGYKQLARRFMRRFAALNDGRRLIVAPEALSRFYISAETGRHGAASIVGATWMTREDREHEILDYVRYLDLLADHVLTSVGAVPVTVLGFSQGVATATRWTAFGSIKPRTLVLWGDYTPPDLDASAAGALAAPDVVLVRGDRDRAFTPEAVRVEAERLAALGIDYRTVTYSGGHDIHEETLLAIAAGGA